MGRLREHVGWETGGICEYKLGKGSHEVVGGPDGRVGAQRVKPWKV